MRILLLWRRRLQPRSAGNCATRRRSDELAEEGTLEQAMGGVEVKKVRDVMLMV